MLTETDIDMVLEFAFPDHNILGIGSCHNHDTEITQTRIFFKSKKHGRREEVREDGKKEVRKEEKEDRNKGKRMGKEGEKTPYKPNAIFLNKISVNRIQHSIKRIIITF